MEIHEEAYFEQMSKDLVNEGYKDKIEFYYPLMPLQYSYVHNLKAKRLEHVQGVEKILGYSDEEFTLDLYYNKLHPIDREIIFETSKENLALANLRIKGKENEGTFESQFTILYRLRAKNGKYIHILRQSTILEYHEKIIRTFSVCTDITELGLTYKVNSAFRYRELKTLYSIQKYRDLLQTKWKKLTPREFEILQLIAEGDTTKKISEKLNISILTVNKHRQNIINKTSSGNIQELLVETFRGGV